MMEIDYTNLSTFSIFDEYPDEYKQKLINDGLIYTSPQKDRCIGAILGMAYGDFVGAPVEFLPAENVSDTVTLKKVSKKYSLFSRESVATTELSYKNTRGVTPMKLGQWTDDTSMGLCLADSLIVNKKFDGSDQRIRYWNWWNCGYNNAFRFDKQQHSVGLGGNISKSLNLEKKEIPSPIYNPPLKPDGSPNNDSGNGSIMRLAAIPIYYRNCSRETIRKYAMLSSLATHPGNDAAEACAFMSHIIVSAINRTHNYEHAKLTPIQYFLISVIAEYETTNNYLQKLINASEPETSTELCWNWKNSVIDIKKTIKNRGSSYNGYPVISSYFGSYCFDGLALALYALYNTTSFDDALLKTINMLGDADSTGSICGQIAGAFYGFSSTNKLFYKLLKQWDHEEILIRAVILYHAAPIEKLDDK